jgi:hypothetical protein
MMKRLAAIACLAALVSQPANAASVPLRASVPRPPSLAVPPASAGTARAVQATIGDTAGGRYIPQPILDILADPHFDPNVAYLLWQLSRKPIADWTLSELAFVAQITPTALEANISITKIQTLYQFWGLDPNDVFNVSLGANWQSQSTAFSNSTAGNVAAISAAECQGDLSQRTVATFEACAGVGQ